MQYRLVCSAGKGFGSRPADDERAAKKGGKGFNKLSPVDRQDAKAVERAVRLVEGRQSAARPVDPREAARGRVEYVKVKNWGSGKPDDLEGLRVQSTRQAFSAGQPFYEQLARRLEALEEGGSLATKQPKGAPPLPSFDRWAFKLDHYLQWLADMRAVHVALEAALAAAVAAVKTAAASREAAAARARAAAAAAGGAADAAPTSSSSLDDSQLGAARMPQQELGAALHLFGPRRFARSKQLAADAERLARLAERERVGSGSAASSSGGGGTEGLPPTNQDAAAYADYLASLARQCQAAESGEELQGGALRLLTHAVVLHLVHLTSGTRIAAAASDKLGLLDQGALSFYRDYPPALGDPLQCFIASVNRLGEMLTEEQRDALLAELPRALVKGSALLAALAREA
eukprot:scaffold9.g3140.t1